MVLSAILDSEMKEMLQLEDAVAHKAGIIGLSDGGDTDVVHEDAKHGELGSVELLVVSKFVEPIAQASALFHAKLVMYRPHKAFVPFHVGMSVD